MNNPWQIYDELIEGISDIPTVEYYQGGYNWSRVMSSEGNMGMAMTFPVVSRATESTDVILIGKPLKEIAMLSKSWNFVEAAIGVAAINCWYNHHARIKKCGETHPEFSANARDAFDVYAKEIEGKKVAIVGHFPFIENRFKGHCEISILERNPSLGDFPDSACEYILQEQDYVFVTASTLVNKTFPRLLALSENAKFIMVGPSTPLTPILFEHGVYGLSGLIINDKDTLENILSLHGASSFTLFDAAEKVDYYRIVTK